MINYGKIAYDAYLASTGGVSLIFGAKLPAWEALAPAIQKAWVDGADAVIRTYQSLEN